MSVFIIYERRVIVIAVVINCLVFPVLGVMVFTRSSMKVTRCIGNNDKLNTGVMDKTKELGDQFQNNLREMVIGLQTNIPNVGIYIWTINTYCDIFCCRKASNHIIRKQGCCKSTCRKTSYK